MSNIIFFPAKNGNYDRVPQNMEELRETLTLQRMEMIDEIVDEVLPNVLSATHELGFSINNDFDIGFMIEAMRSAMMRSAGIHNPMQEIADKMVVVRNEKGQHVYANGEILTT